MQVMGKPLLMVLRPLKFRGRSLLLELSPKPAEFSKMTIWRRNTGLRFPQTLEVSAVLTKKVKEKEILG